MGNGKKDSTAKKLAAESPLPVPGPMLGKKGLLNPNFVADDTLQDALKKIIEDTSNPDKVLPDTVLNDNKKKQRFAFAVADLTFESAKVKNVPGDAHYDASKPINDPDKIAYAGWNDTANLEICSMAKILPFYAAFQLRADIRGLFQKLKTDLGTAPTMTQLKDEAKKRYEIIYADLDITTINVPDLAKIFTLDGGAVNFLKVKTSDAGFVASNFNSSNELDDGFLGDARSSESGVNKLKFYEQMRLMVGWSDDYAASLLIGILGYEFMWALANRSGLYRSSWDKLTKDDKAAAAACGLFLAADYENTSKRWAVKGRPEAAKAVESSHLTKDKSGMRRMANARSIAILMTMLGKELLIEHESHVEMEEMMRRTSANFDGEDAPIGEGMHESGWNNQQVQWVYGSAIPALDPDKRLGAAKVGWWGDATGCCCTSNALLVRSQRASGKILSAVLVAIDNEDNKPAGIPQLEKFGKAVAKILDARHP